MTGKDQQIGKLTLRHFFQGVLLIYNLTEAPWKYQVISFPLTAVEKSLCGLPSGMILKHSTWPPANTSRGVPCRGTVAEVRGQHLLRLHWLDGAMSPLQIQAVAMGTGYTWPTWLIQGSCLQKGMNCWINIFKKSVTMYWLWKDFLNEWM